MVTVRERLERLRRGDAASAQTGCPVGSVPSSSATGSGRGSVVQPDLATLVPGYEYSGPAGRCYVAGRRFPIDYRHGSISLGALLDVDPAHLAWLSQNGHSGGLDLRRTAFLDTETTGLAGGTGTYAFLIGIGYYAPADDGGLGHFVVRQYFMRGYEEEPALLEAVERLLGRFATVVSFNGRAFDWPLIETRFRMNRRPCRLEDPWHLDLLFPARRIWRERLPSCALKDLEPAVLGVRRQGDVPGWAIPGIYFHFLRDRNPRPLRPVFYHNLLDILSLSTLATRLAGVIADPARVANGDAYGAGQLYETRGQWERAIACYEMALQGQLPDHLRLRCARRLSLLYKRARRWPAAVSLWERCLDESDPDLFSHLELAKYYEHIARDHRRADEIVGRALLRLEVQDIRLAESNQTNLALRRDLEKRRGRLRVKLSGEP